VLRIVTALTTRLRSMRTAVLVCVLAGLLPLAQGAQGIELTTLLTQRQDGGITLDFGARLSLPRPVDEALQRGVPLYFVAQAVVYRQRWYWRDAEVAHATRSWRLSYQPLSNAWRVSLGGLAQTYASLGEALLAVSRAGRWKIADAAQLEPDGRYYIEFSYRLDTSQLPRPMQVGIGGQADWVLEIERLLKLD
jgi:hypothetical protein